MDIGVQLAGERATALRFEKFPDFAHDRLLAALQQIEQRLEAAVIAAEPSKSGELRSLTGGRVYDHGDRIAAVVGVRTENANQAKKAAALEYGSRGVAVSISAHLMRLDHFWSRAVSARQVTVPGYSRTPHILAQRFLRTPVDAIRAEALAEMQQALKDAIADAEGVS